MKEKMKKKRKENKNGRKKNGNTIKKQETANKPTPPPLSLPPSSPRISKPVKNICQWDSDEAGPRQNPGPQPPLALASAQFYHYISKYLSCTPSPDLRARRRPGVAPIALPARRNSLGVPSFCCLFFFLFRSFLLLLSPFVDFSLVSCALFSLGFI